MACYLAEMALFQKDFVSKSSSDLARSALALARCILNRPQPLQSEWASQYDPQTLVTLSQQCHRPSAILARKYASAQLSRVSMTLDDFLARQASLVKAYPAPPTPPSEQQVPHPDERMMHPATPQKKHYLSGPHNGCPTPPITPTNQEYFAGQPPPMETFQRPPTPNSMTRGSVYAPCPSSCVLPSIRQVAPIF